MGKTPTVSAGPASGNDAYSATEEQIASGALFLPVLTNDSKKTTLYSLDNGEPADLLTQDQVLVANQSRLGASIWITADGRIGYSLDSARAQSLAAGETLIDSFIYAIRLASGSLVWQSVQVTITGTNDGPVAAADVGSVTEDSIATGSVALNDSDVDHGAVLSFAATGQLPAGFAMAGDGSWALDASNPAYQSLGAGQMMQVTVAYTVTDERGAASSSTLTLTITGTNDAPRVSGAVGGGASEDGVPVGLDALANASDVDGNALTVVNVPAAGDLPAGVTYDAATHSFTLDPANAAYQQLGLGQTVTITVNYGVSDGTATTAASVSWVVTGTNDGPAAAPAFSEVAEDGTVSGQLTASDPDHGAALTYDVAKGAPPGFSLAADGSWTFDANQFEYQALAEGESAGILVTCRVTDEHGASSLSSLTLTVAGANDAPVATSTAAEVAEGETVSGQLFAMDQDHGAQLSFAVAEDTPAGFALAADGSWTFDAGHDAYQALGAGQIQIVQVPFTATDEHGATASSFLVIAITGTNDAPVLQGAPAVLPAGTEDSSYTVTQEQLVAGWADPEGFGVYAVGLTASNATLVTNEDFSFTITPDADFNGVLQLTYQVTDGFAASAAEASLTIDSVNDPAMIGGAVTGLVTESRYGDDGVSASTGNLTISDLDGAAAFLAVTAPEASAGGYGSFALSGSGAWIYTLDNSHSALVSLNKGQSLTDSFTVYASDGTAQTIQVTINGATDWTTAAAFTGAGDSQDYDSLLGAAGTDRPESTVTGTSSADVATGSSLAQTFDMLAGNDTVYARAGDDNVSGGDGFDNLYGQSGNDLLDGGLLNDFMYGGTGNDRLLGGDGMDTVRGGSGADVLDGGAGMDFLIGGFGADTLTGGADRDAFIFTDLRDSGDTITDCQFGTETIDFSAVDANSAMAGDQAFAFSRDGAAANSIWTVQNGANLEIYADTDGNANTAEFMVTLQDVTYSPHPDYLPNNLVF